MHCLVWTFFCEREEEEERGDGSVSKRARARPRVQGCVETDLAIVVADREVLRELNIAHVHGGAVLLGHLQTQATGLGGARRAGGGEEGEQRRTKRGHGVEVGIGRARWE
jgi:hypothetical protein